MQLNKRKLVLVASLLSALALFNARVQAATITIPASASHPISDADTTKPGFIWRVSHTATGINNSTADSEKLLAGGFGDNLADPSVQGVADAVGKVGGKSDPIEYNIPTVINLDKAAGSNGNFTPDDQMPGSPGTDGISNNIAAEILDYVQIPAPGDYTFGVNSDDGFRMKIGGAVPQDQFAIVVGEFNGGRGAADTTFTVHFDGAGLYAMRTTWENGGSGSNVEIFHLKADGSTKVLLNDTANGGLATFRGLKTSTAVVYASAVNPTPGGTGVIGNSAVSVVLQGASALAATDVKLSLDGTPTGAVATKSGDSISIKFTPTALYAPASKHTATITYGTTTHDWQFTVADYVTLKPGDKVTPDTSKPGFSVLPYQVDVGLPNTIFGAETALAGKWPEADGTFAPNIADLSGATENGRFAVAGVVNWNEHAPDNPVGDFTDANGYPDALPPGIPGTAGGADNYVEEIVSYVDLPAGVITMGVNSDDGFQTTEGFAGDVFATGTVLGNFNGGRGSSDSIFSFVVQEAGVYPLRTIYFEGGGDSNVEWFTVQPDGTKVLINDSKVATAAKSYRAVAAGTAKALARKVVPAPNSGGAAFDTAITVELVDGGAALDPKTVTLKLDGAAVAATATKAANVTTVTFKPATPFAEASTHSATLAYTDGTTAITRDWKFTTLNQHLLAYWDFNDASDPKNAADKAGGHTASLVLTAAYSADAAGHTGKAGDRALQLPMDGTDGERAEVTGPSDSFFLNDAGRQDQLAISFWQKLDEVRNSSAFWSGGPSSDRYFQAHAPWGDSTIYFDTVACCDGTQRISKSLNDLAEANGDAATFLSSWHFFVFQKNGPLKQVFVDGKLFFDGQNIAPLPTNFNAFQIGAFNGGSSTHGLIDDVALYATALSTDEISKLLAGTTPDKLGRPTSGPGTGGTPEFTKVSFTAGKLHIEWSVGKLQKGGTVAGPWTDVAGATSPRDIDPTDPVAFYRLVP